MTTTNPNLKSVLIIGGCGFLGHRIVTEILSSHAAKTITVLDLRTSHDRVPGVTYHNGDITSKSSLQSIFSQVRPQVVIHTASPPALAHDLDLYTKVNVEGTKNLIECSLATEETVAFVYTSSASVIHDSVSDLHDGDESFPIQLMPQQREAYSHTKALAENLVLTANGQNGRLQTTALRPSGLFGENDPTTAKAMVEAAASGKYRYQVGDGRNMFDWTYVGNAAQAHVLAAQALIKYHTEGASADEGVAGEAFFVTNGETMPFWDFARALGAAAGYPTNPEEIRVIPKSVGLLIATIAEWAVWITSFGRRRSTMTRQGIRFSTMTRTFRIDKARARLKYRPLVDLKEGIRRAGRSFANNTEKAK